MLSLKLLVQLNNQNAGYGLKKTSISKGVTIIGMNYSAIHEVRMASLATKIGKNS